MEPFLKTILDGVDQKDLLHWHQNFYYPRRFKQLSHVLLDKNVLDFEEDDAGGQEILKLILDFECDQKDRYEELEKEMFATFIGARLCRDHARKKIRKVNAKQKLIYLAPFG